MRMEYTDVARDGEHVPVILQQLPNWCRWGMGTAPSGKPTKVPSGSTNDPSMKVTWETIRYVPRTDLRGIGFVFTGGAKTKDGWVIAFDLDGCRDPKTGGVAPWAAGLIVRLDNTYTEVTPSGYGLRCFVVVRQLPQGEIAKKVRPDAVSTLAGKTAEMQLFGLGVAEYVTITGWWLRATKPTLTVLDNLDALIEAFSLRRQAKPSNAQLPIGEGDVPTVVRITEKLQRVPHGRELLDGNWKATKCSSASEAFFLLTQHVLRAAGGHGKQALQFLLRHTAWGKGLVDDSRDPSKYMRADWVEKELLRVANKTHAVTGGAEVFDVLPPLEAAPPPPLLGDAGNPLRFLDAWPKDRPLVHLPTGIPSLDERTGGGFVLGSRVYCAGAPDAGKTALVVQIADHYLSMGIVVGIHAVDEEGDDLLTRFLQRRGISRAACEAGGADTVAFAREALAGLPMRVYDGSTTIEKAAVDLHRFAAGRPCVLIVDSVQVARAEDENGDESLYKVVTNRVAVLRAAASRYRMLVIATSEMNRGAYKSKKAEDQTADMASAKESGAIEFSARVLLALRSVPGTNDMVELRIAKNKHGPSHRSDENGIFLKVDRARQQLSEDTGFAPLDEDEAKAEALSGRTAADTRALVALLREQGPFGVNEMEGLMAARGVPRNRARTACAALRGYGVLAESVGPRNAKMMALGKGELPPELSPDSDFLCS